MEIREQQGANPIELANNQRLHQLLPEQKNHLIVGAVVTAIFSMLLVCSNQSEFRTSLSLTSPKFGGLVVCSLFAAVILKKYRCRAAAPAAPPTVYALKWIQNNSEIYACYENAKWKYLTFRNGAFISRGPLPRFSRIDHELARDNLAKSDLYTDEGGTVHVRRIWNPQILHTEGFPCGCLHLVKNPRNAEEVRWRWLNYETSTVSYLPYEPKIRHSYFYQHKAWHRILLYLDADRISRVSVGKIGFSSVFVPSGHVTIEEDKCAVTLVSAGDEPYGHAMIAFEGINVKQQPYLKYAHLTGQYGVVLDDREGNREHPFQHHAQSDTVLVSAARIQNMVRAIQADINSGVRLHMVMGGDNCYTWCRKILDKIDLCTPPRSAVPRLSVPNLELKDNHFIREVNRNYPRLLRSSDPVEAAAGSLGLLMSMSHDYRFERR